jgi:uncharacterized protein with HEPN domain
MTLPDFISDKKTRDAVLRNFEELGEAAKRIPEPIRLSDTAIEWRKISNFRNVLIHDYFGINYEIVWNILNDYLPQQFTLLKNPAAHLS